MSARWCILDDIFPNVLSAFRVAEYNAYLESAPGLTILSSHPRLEQFKLAYAQLYPQFAERVQPLTAAAVQGNQFAYMVFLNNANTFLNGLHRLGIPFAFTLYPGGGFGLNEPESDAKLQRVMGSQLLQAVLTTQNATHAYLAQKAPHVSRQFLWGGVIHPAYFSEIHQAEAARRQRFGREKLGFDLCFVAQKYMPDGANKGWPVFAAAAKELVAADSRVRVHVVGGFGPEDYVAAVGQAPAERINFEPHMHTEQLRKFLLQMDAIASPNEPFKLHPGNFDGFPTGCCIEAALCGAAMILTDVLALNPLYQDGKDIVFIEPQVRDLVDRVHALMAQPAELARIGEAGRRSTHNAFHPNRQIGRRKIFLNAAAAKAGVELGFADQCRREVGAL
jgi:lipopolysaccharide transport system ATP-binding protein